MKGQALATILLLITVLVAGCQQDSAAEGPPVDLSFRTLDGKTASLAAYRGKPVVLNYFGLHCVPCCHELPHFEAALDKHKDELAMIVLTTDPWDIAPFVKKYGYTMTFGYDLGGARSLGVTAIPRTFFFDRDGVLVSDQPGELTPDLLELGIKRILKESR